jgi:hypothetical protein
MRLELRREWWEERRAKVREELLGIRPVEGVGVMMATKVAREFVEAAKAYSPHAEKEELESLEHEL